MDLGSVLGTGSGGRITDEDVERAARVSYGFGTRKVSQTRGLVRYLRRHRHTTPSEMVELKFHCAMPMFVARQWIRHRTASVNETSTRYSIAIDAAQRTAPDQWRIRELEEEVAQPADREHDREHIQRNPHRSQQHPTVEIHVWIQLAILEV